MTVRASFSMHLAFGYGGFRPLGLFWTPGHPERRLGHLVV